MSFYLKNLQRLNIMKHDSTVFLLGYITNFNSLGGVIIPTFFCVSKNGTQDVYAYDHALKFSILQENPSLKQTETANC